MARVAVLLAASRLALSPTWAAGWEINFNGTATESIDRAEALVVDAAGDVVAVGRTQNAGTSFQDFTVVKFSGKSGQEIWHRFIGGTDSSLFDSANAVALDAGGDVIAVGLTQNLGTFRDFTAVKLSGADGGEIWRQVINGSADQFDEAGAVAVDAAGDVVAAGSTTNSETRGTDFIVVKLSGSDGAEIWRRLLVGGDAAATTVAVDATGDVIAGGSFQTHEDGGAVFGVVKLSGTDGAELWHGAPFAAGVAQAIGLDAFGDVVAAGSTTGFTVVKFAGSSGAELWRQVINDGGSADAFAVALGASGDVVATGYIVDTNGDEETVVKFSGATGAELWRSRGCAAAGGASLAAVQVDVAGDVVAAGNVKAPHTNMGTSPRRNVYVFDFAVFKLAGASGGEQWCNVLQGTDPTGSLNAAQAVALDAAGNVVAAGSVRNIGAGARDFAAVKLDAVSGEELWRGLVDGSRNLSTDRSLAVAFDPAGDVIASGETLNIGTRRDFTIVKVAGGNGAKQWEREIDGSAPDSVDRGVAVVVDGAGDVVSAGVTQNVETGPDFTVIKLSGVDGKSVWKQSINGTANGFDAASALTLGSAGSVIAAGQTENAITGPDFTVIEFAGADGSEKWRRVINGSADGPDIANALAVDVRGDVVAAGTIENLDSRSDFLVTKLRGSSGAEIWRQEVSGTAGGIDQALAVAVDSAGGVVAVGSTQNTAPGSDFTVIKFEGSSGTELWRAAIKGTADGFDSARAVVVDAAGDVLAAGGISNAKTILDFVVVKLAGASGAELWRTVYDGGGDQDLAVAVGLDRSGDPIATGTTFNGTGFDFTVIKLAAADGHALWRRNFNGNRTDGVAPTDAGFQVAVDAHGDVAAVGFTENSLTGWDFTVVKLNGSDGTSFTAPSMPPSAPGSADGCSTILVQQTRGRAAWMLLVPLLGFLSARRGFDRQR